MEGGIWVSDKTKLRKLKINGTLISKVSFKFNKIKRQKVSYLWKIEIYWWSVVIFVALWGVIIGHSLIWTS